jgi:hypothetical protein
MERARRASVREVCYGVRYVAVTAKETHRRDCQLAQIVPNVPLRRGERIKHPLEFYQAILSSRCRVCRCDSKDHHETMPSRSP